MQRLVDQGEKFDAVITDPPFHLVSIQKRFGKPDSAPAQFGKDGLSQRMSRGMQGMSWDGIHQGEIPVAFDSGVWTLVRQLLRPGGRLLAFGGTRTFHHMCCAIEISDFEYEDTIVWVFGTGAVFQDFRLKPGQSPIAMARAPGPVFDLGIAECEVPADPPRRTKNLIHDGSSDVVALFPDSQGQIAKRRTDGSIQVKNVYGKSYHTETEHPEPRGDSGSATRFFNACPFTENEMEEIRLIYNRKCTAKDRRGSKHPTLKSISLLRHLVRLVVPKGGSVLDPFAGSGTLGEAALLEGRTATMIEREDDYATDAMMRMVAVEIGV